MSQMPYSRFWVRPQVVPAGVFLFQSDYGRENEVGHAFPTL